MIAEDDAYTDRIYVCIKFFIKLIHLEGYTVFPSYFFVAITSVLKYL